MLGVRERQRFGIKDVAVPEIRERGKITAEHAQNLTRRPGENPAIERGIAEVGREPVARHARERPRHHQGNQAVENEGPGLDHHLITNSLSVPCVMTTCAPIERSQSESSWPRPSGIAPSWTMACVAPEERSALVAESRSVGIFRRNVARRRYVSGKKPE